MARFRLSVGTILGLAMLNACFAQEPRKLTVTDSEPQGLLGFAATFSGDVGFAGAPGGTGMSGKGYLFDLTNGQKSHTLTPSVNQINDMFGFNAALSGQKLLVGDPGNPFAMDKVPGSAYVFDVQSGTELSRLQPDDSVDGDEFGFGINLHDNLAIIGAPNLGVGRGAAYLFDAESGSQLHRLTPSDSFQGDEFGFDVAVNENYAVVGAPRNFDTLGFAKGAAYVFDTQTGQQIQRLEPGDSFGGNEFGFDVAIDGTTAIVGAPNGGSGLGAAYLFDVVSGRQLARLSPRDSTLGNDFGGSVDISGNMALVGASGLNAVLGSAYLFDVRTGKQLTKLSPTDIKPGNAFGASVALAGDLAFIGSPRDDEIGKNTGAAYLYQLVVVGDFNSNGQFDAGDIDALSRAVRDGDTDAKFDLNEDGLVSRADRTVWVNEVANTYFGDANLDCLFSSEDLVLILQGGQYEDDTPNNSTWASGDFNGDFDFGSGDLVVALQTGAYEKGPRTTAVAVPEPSGLLRCALSAMLVAVVGRRRVKRA